jgi:hypothetical protein
VDLRDHGSRADSESLRRRANVHQVLPFRRRKPAEMLADIRFGIA